MRPDPFPLETSSSHVPKWLVISSVILPPEQQWESSSTMAEPLWPLHLSAEGLIRLKRTPVKLLLVPSCNYTANCSPGAQTQTLPSAESASKRCSVLLNCTSGGSCLGTLRVLKASCRCTDASPDPRWGASVLFQVPLLVVDKASHVSRWSVGNSATLNWNRPFWQP